MAGKNTTLRLFPGDVNLNGRDEILPGEGMGGGNGVLLRHEYEIFDL